MKFKSLLCVFVALSISCTREKKETTNVVFQLPAVASQKASNFSLLSLEDNAEDFDLFDSWSTITPSGIDTGDYSINCYVVMVGGPDPAMNINYCGRKSATDSKSIVKMFSFGPWLGAIPASASGAQIELEVPAGNDRVFYLVGFHALTATACTDFRKSSPSQAELTRPYIISQVNRVSLQPGGSTTIAMVRTFETEKWFDDCKFTDGSSSEGEKRASIIGVQKLSRPEKSVIISASATAGEGKCSPLKVRLMDEYFRPARYTENLKVKLQHCVGQGSDCYDVATADTSGFTSLETYDSYTDCAGSEPGEGREDFDISQGDRDTVRWVRSPFGSVDNMFIFATAMNPATPFTIKSPDKFLVRADTDKTAYLSGPSKIIAEQCYRFEGRYMQHDGTVAGGAKVSGIQLQSKTAANTFTDISSGRIFADSTCATAINLSPLPTFSSPYVFYVKAPDSQNLKLLIQPDTGGDVDYMFLSASGGSSTPRHVRHVGSQIIKNGNFCHAMSLHLLNEAGALVRATSATGLTFSLVSEASNSNINSDDLTFYSDSTCSTVLGNFTIPSGQTSVEFFMKSSATNDGHRYIQFTDGQGIFGDKEFYLF